MDWASRPHPFKQYPTKPKTDLPAPEREEQTGLWPLARLPGEESAPLDIRAVSRILFLCCGITFQRRMGGEAIRLRAAASAGALYPAEVYLAAARIDGLPPGLYHYSIHPHALRRIRDLPEGFTENEWFITGIFFRSAWKYRDRAFRYILLDTGHVLENLCLSLSARGVKHFVRLDFDDDRAARFLGIDPEREACLARVGTCKTDLLEGPGLDAGPDPELAEASR